MGALLLPQHLPKHLASCHSYHLPPFPSHHQLLPHSLFPPLRSLPGAWARVWHPAQGAQADGSDKGSGELPSNLTNYLTLFMSTRCTTRLGDIFSPLNLLKTLPTDACLHSPRQQTIPTTSPFNWADVGSLSYISKAGFFLSQNRLYLNAFISGSNWFNLWKKSDFPLIIVVIRKIILNYQNNDQSLKCGMWAYKLLSRRR